MKIYISGPITGRDWNVTKARFDEAERLLEEQGHEVVNPCVLKPLPLMYEEYMTIDFMLITMCDAMYMLSGWESSRGAYRERKHALERKINVYYEENK